MTPGGGTGGNPIAHTAPASTVATSIVATSTVIAFPARMPLQVAFDRIELQRILDVYGRMVAAGQWRDYAMDFARDAASFSAFRRCAEHPQMRVEKRPALRGKQGMWTLFGEGGQVLKRGQELVGVLSLIERKLLKVVDG